ncbi:MAG: ribulose-phosphate 3-epimerase [Deltaproteobacteria bacterium]|nr:ribulose-phosphate 3-epimerase [Deltaproteobacteria bacterium]
MTSVLVAPSLLAADPMSFRDEVHSVEKAGADWHHVDVMDGHFVPNLTYGLQFIAALKKISTLPLDVHIMVSNPDIVALDYVKAGADRLTFHVEAAIHAHRLTQAIRGAGAKVGVALNPGTPVETVLPLIYDVDSIMFMSVNPGYGGQQYIPQTAGRIQQLSKSLEAAGLDQSVLIEVDGGINEKTGAEVVAAGARVLVAGTFIFGATDRSLPIKRLHNLGS